jgi:hypothetical protein
VTALARLLEALLAVASVQLAVLIAIASIAIDDRHARFGVVAAAVAALFLVLHGKG